MSELRLIAPAEEATRVTPLAPRLVPLEEVAHLKLALPSGDSWIDDVGWVPVNDTEFHLAARYFPLAVSYEDGNPVLGLLVGSRYINRRLVDAAGAWRGGYRPIALRCFPFRVRNLDGDPLRDILIDANSRYLTGGDGRPIVDAGGPNPLIVEVYRLFRLLYDGQRALAPALDQLLIADLLVPLAGSDGEVTTPDGRTFLGIDRERFTRLDGRTLGAMARRDFMSVDVAVASLFSQQWLRQGLVAVGSRSRQPAKNSIASAQPLAALFTGLESLDIALDDDELVSLADVEALRTLTGQRTVQDAE